MSTLETAIQLAVRAHAGQMDKAGQPYILHPLRLMLRMEHTDAMMAAVLHDVVEDTDHTLDDLRAMGFSDTVVAAVAALTRHANESYDAFIARAAQNPIARAVKLADLADNMDIRRLQSIGDKDVERLQRYLKHWRELSKAQ